MAARIPGYGALETLYESERTVVYRAKSLDEGRSRILKLPAAEHPSPQVLARMRHEWEVTRELEGPGIGRAIDYQRRGHGLMLVFEDIGARALSKVLAERRLDVDEFLEVALELTEALGRVHAQGVIHKDINPYNIVWNQATGRVQIIDFDIATRLSQEWASGGEDRSVGTLRYMSPEQTGRTARTVDYRTDFYSLGATFYELLCGQRACEGRDKLELFHCQLARQPEPPHQVRPGVPRMLSHIIMRLLAKPAEERYQSAHGLAKDLERCLNELRTRGQVLPFELGEHDARATLQVSQRLYGRRAQLDRLLEDFEQARSGRSLLTLLTGHAGVGKSALVRQMQRAIVATRARFVAAKFDQYHRDQPYAALADALDALAAQLLTLPDDEIERWRERIRGALGDNRELLADIVPRLEALLGPGSRVGDESGEGAANEMSPEEARHRLGRALRAFVDVFCEPERPLVIFVDDLQWAGRTSLDLLGELIGDPELDHLLIIGAFRDNDIGPTHPLTVSLRQMRDGGAAIDQVHIEALGRAHVVELIADTLQRPLDEVADFGELAYQKTSGNPYFLNRFLEDLYAHDLLWFDAEAGVWDFDLDAIAEQALTDNVVDLLIERMRQLPQSTQDALQMAGLLGTSFNVDTLATVCEASPVEAYRAMRPAIDDGIVIARSELELADPQDVDGPVLARSLAFPHDRVQEAAAQLMDPERLPQARLKVGHLLEERWRRTGEASLLFDVVGHLNAARDLLDSDAERLELARLDVRAARRAMAALAFSTAADLLEIARDLMPDDIWSHQPDLAVETDCLLGDALTAIGRFAEAEALLDALLERTDDPIDRARIYRILVRQYTHRAAFEQAGEAAQAGLRELGVEFPLEDLGAAQADHIRRVQQRLDGRPISAILDVERVDHPTYEAALQLLGAFQPAAGLIDRRLLLIAGLQAIELSLQIGVRQGTILGLAAYGLTRVELGQFQEAYEAGDLSLALARKFHDDYAAAHAGVLHGAFLALWTRPLDETIALLAEAHAAGVRSGNFLMAGYALSLQMFQRFCRNQPLAEILEAIDDAESFGEATRNRVAVDQFQATRRMARHLRGLRDDDAFVRGEDPQWSDDLLEAFRAHDDDAIEVNLLTARGVFSYLYGHCEQALDDLTQVETRMPAMLYSVDVSRVAFYTAMTHLERARGVEGDPREHHLAQAASLRDSLATWAKACPFNCEHELALVDAELAWARGRRFEAVEHFDRAASLAQEREFLEIEALANERAALFWRAQDKPRFARMHMRQARYAYQLWGAEQKVAQLEANFAELLEPVAEASRPSSASSTTDDIDVDAVFQAAETITRHIQVDDLLTSLMRVTVASAGAERGAFFLRRPEGLVLAVQGRAEDQPRLVDPPRRLEKWDDGPRSVVRYAARTREPVVVGRASQDERFARDAYIAEHPVRSVLSVPITEAGDLTGVLYLENNLTDDAFAEDRLRVLKILAGQIAAALSKAQMYEAVREEKERFRQLAEHIHEVFWLMDWPQRQIVYVSPAYASTWGRRIPELPIGVERWLEAVVPEDRARVSAALDAEVARGEYDIIYQIERPSGSRRWIRDRGFPIHSADGETYRIAGVAEDITRQHEVERMKDEFISVVSHELRTPLTPIKGIFDLLSRSEELRASAHHQKLIDLGLRNSKRLLRLIDDLLDIQKLSLSNIHFDNETVDLVEVVREAIQINEPLGDSKNIEFVLDVVTPELEVEADRQRLTQVLTNLMSNAVKFSEPDAVVELSVERADDRARICVADHGAGIPEEARERIFEKFVQADSSLTRRHGGAGLGLAISQAIVERLGGRIYFDSEVDKGTTFFVDLPLA